MGLFNKKKIEQRADTTVDSVLLNALVGNSSVTKQTALNIPSLSGGIEYIANTISMLPIKLYKEKNGEVEEVKGDIRCILLNDDTGDTLDAVQFWKAIISDYFLGKGGYAYINKETNKYKSIHYVNEESVNTNKNTNAIFKDYNILVDGNDYKPYDFIKILRKTKDGCQGVSIIEENPLIISVGYNTLKYEEGLYVKGGNKRGFLKSAKTLTQKVIDDLKAGWKKLYANNEENIVVLNEGIEFQEASNSSVEMQMNENKETNSNEICKILNIPINIIKGNATQQDYINGFKTGVMPVIKAIECALNKDFLLEKEKFGDEVFYWSFDTKEITKGDIKARYDAYALGIEKGFLKIDEARYMEDLQAFNIDWINLGLNSVLFDTKTKEIYTPNTNQTQNMDALKGGEKIEDRDTE